MKRIGIYVLALVLAIGMSCGTDAPEVPETSTMFMFKVDYTDNSFEGGVTFTLQKIPLPLVSEIPLEVDKDEATTDTDGAVAIIYESSSDILFNAVLTNLGNAAIVVPSFIDPANFLVAAQAVDLPAGIDIESIDGDHSQVDFAPIWAAISDLAITDFALEENTKIGLYLYQPSTDPAFSANWDWIVFLYNQ